MRISAQSCNDPSLPDFWLDICRNIPTNASEYINLQLNPERWTGYNGSHIWNAIYHENCFAKLGEFDDMCYEERVLYRLLSGMHASVNIHIAATYYPPSKAKNRTTWASAPQRFMEQYGNKPEFLKNLYFSFVVLLRALRRAGPYLYNLPFTGSGSAEEALKTQYLVRRLLDAGLMTSCSSVFDAFDESLMFSNDAGGSSTLSENSVKATLKSQWKGVFHNISQVMDCITCQKCRLHGKIQLLGIGTALKILLLPEQLIAASLERSELVALFNTLGKFSTAIQAIPRLSQEFYDLKRPYITSDILQEEVPAGAKQANAPVRAPSQAPQDPRTSSSSTSSKLPTRGADDDGNAPMPSVGYEAMDAGVAAVARAAAAGKIQDAATENAIIDALLNREEDVLLLAKHYAGVLPERFMQHASRAVTRAGRIAVRFSAGDAEPAAPMVSKDTVDVVVIGGGLAGLSAALTILDAGGRVVLLEKMGHLGGNSAWASSGINAVDVNDTSTQDTVEIFTSDVTKAAGRGDNPLISVLTSGSVDALAWLRSRVKENLNLDLVGQMGGHSKARTHRPSSGLAGSAMIFALQKQLEKYTVEPAGGGKPPFELMKWTRATALVTRGDAVRGVEYAVVTAKDQETPVRNGVVLGEHVLLATGGYASDYTADSLLKKHRPDLLKYATTNNKGTTGDGHKLALAVGAHAVDLDDVQVHPTGFHTHLLPHPHTRASCTPLTKLNLL